MISQSLHINLVGLDWAWSEQGARMCAVCGKDFDQEDDDTPLLLWRNNGKEMLAL